MAIEISLMYLVQTIIFPGILLFFILGFLSNWFFRKIYAKIQLRRGPVTAGPLGMFQAFADFIKTATKEEIIPETANPLFFRFLPIIASVPIIVGLFFIPIIGPEGIISSAGDIYIIVFILTTVAAIEITLGWASGSRFALIGASRSGTQLVSFGIPLIFSMLYPVIKAGSFTFKYIVLQQGEEYIPYILPKWNLISLGVISFAIYIVCALAELEKPPFDTPEAETEIAGGWNLEYSGRNYAFIILMENLKMVLILSLGVTLFMGGPLGPTFNLTGILLAVLYFIYFLAKYVLLLTFLTIVSSTMARLKIKEIVSGTWSLLTPIAIGFILLIMVIGA